MDLKGLILLSSALNFQTITPANENDLPYLLNLPSYTAVAWYHHKLTGFAEGPGQDACGRAAVGGSGVWAGADRGRRTARRPAAKVIATLHRFTSLPEAYIDRCNLRIPAGRFAAELLRDERRVVGILDGRVTGFPVDPSDASSRYDPSLVLVSGPFASALQDYLRRDLEFRTDQPYVYLSHKANESWDWGSAAEGYVDVTDDLLRAMTEQADLRVFGGMGYFDLTTGYFGQRYAFNHLGLAPQLGANLHLVCYPSGHQIYTQDASRKKLASDVAEFVRAAGTGSTAPAR